MMTSRAVFVDRDGTMAKDVSYCSCTEDFKLFTTTPQAVRLLNEHGFRVIVITNQSGIARGYFTEETLTKIHEKMKRELTQQGAWVDAIYYCPHHPDDNCEWRKPKPKLGLQATEDFDIDLECSFVVGDLPMDIELGRLVGCRTILINDSPSKEGDATRNPDAIASDLLGAAQKILSWEEGKAV